MTWKVIDTVHFEDGDVVIIQYTCVYCDNKFFWEWTYDEHQEEEHKMSDFDDMKVMEEIEEQVRIEDVKKAIEDEAQKEKEMKAIQEAEKGRKEAEEHANTKAEIKAKKYSDDKVEENIRFEVESKTKKEYYLC